MNRLSLYWSLLLFLVACSNSQQDVSMEETLTLPPQYFYYPRANVYFDSANKNYFFQSNDSLAWQTAKQIPAVVQALMDKNVMLQNPPDPVWRDNENHRLVYSSLLYATPEDTIAKKKVIKTVRKPVVTVTDTTATAEKKERKGVGKLLDKLFGRKKKKEEPDSASQ